MLWQEHIPGNFCNICELLQENSIMSHKEECLPGQRHLHWFLIMPMVLSLDTLSGVRKSSSDDGIVSYQLRIIYSLAIWDIVAKRSSSSVLLYFMAGQSTIVTMERAKEIPSHCDFHVEWVIADPCTTTRHSCGSNGNQKKNNCGESSSSVLVREYYKINRPPGHGIVSQKSVHAITVIKSNATSLRWRSLFIYISCPVPSALAWIEIEGDRAVPSLLCISSWSGRL